MRARAYNIAHQGFSAHYPPNTLTAFRQAVAAGADIIELDVVATADNVVVVSHDTTVDRCTDGHGYIPDMTLAQVKALDAGIRFGAQFAGERIPTLEETIAWARTQPVRLCIEIKADTTEQYLRHGRLTVALLQRLNHIRPVTLTSFSPTLVRAIRAQEPLLAVALDPPVQDGSCTAWEVVQEVLACGANFVLHDYRGLRAEIVAEAHQHGFALWAWTADEPDDMRRVLDMGVDGLMTNRPDLLRDVLRERSAP